MGGGTINKLEVLSPMWKTQKHVDSMNLGMAYFTVIALGLLWLIH